MFVRIFPHNSHNETVISYCVIAPDYYAVVGREGGRVCVCVCEREGEEGGSARGREGVRVCVCEREGEEGGSARGREGVRVCVCEREGEEGGSARGRECI